MRSNPVFLDTLVEMLAAGRSVKFTAEGNSMWPAIRHGETIVVGPATSCEPGDVLLVLVAGRPVAHRYVGDVAGRIVTAGDAHTRRDRPVEKKHVLGRVTAVERGGARIAPRGRVTAFRRAANAAALAFAGRARRAGRRLRSARIPFPFFVPSAIEE